MLAEQNVPHHKPSKDYRLSELSVWLSGLDSNCRDRIGGKMNGYGRTKPQTRWSRSGAAHRSVIKLKRLVGLDAGGRDKPGPHLKVRPNDIGEAFRCSATVVRHTRPLQHRLQDVRKVEDDIQFRIQSTYDIR